MERIEALLNVVENSAGDLEKADLAEQRVIEEVRQLARSLGEETSPGSLVKLDNKRALAKVFRDMIKGLTFLLETAEFKNEILESQTIIFSEI